MSVKEIALCHLKDSLYVEIRVYVDFFNATTGREFYLDIFTNIQFLITSVQIKFTVQIQLNLTI